MRPQSIQDLSKDTAQNWLRVGRVLCGLEAESPADPSGRSWQEVVKQRLLELGVEISDGHLYKIRRAASFLLDQAPHVVTDEIDDPPRISAVEVAERLQRLDLDAGKQALSELLQPHPVSFTELQRRYEALLAERPDRKNLRQIAWDKRRDTIPQNPSDKVEGASGASMSDADPLPDKGLVQAAGPSDGLRRQLGRLASNAWSEGWQAGQEMCMTRIEAMQKQIDAQQIRIEENAQALREQQEETWHIVKQISEHLGIFPEDLSKRS